MILIERVFGDFDDDKKLVVINPEELKNIAMFSKNNSRDGETRKEYDRFSLQRVIKHEFEHAISGEKDEEAFVNAVIDKKIISGDFKDISQEEVSELREVAVQYFKDPDSTSISELFLLEKYDLFMADEVQEKYAKENEENIEAGVIARTNKYMGNTYKVKENERIGHTVNYICPTDNANDLDSKFKDINGNILCATTEDMQFAKNKFLYSKKDIKESILDPRMQNAIKQCEALDFKGQGIVADCTAESILDSTPQNNSQNTKKQLH